MPPSDSANSVDGYQIRPAQPSDAKPFRMILPEVRDAAIRLVAESVADGRLVAAAALTKSMRPKPPVGPGTAVHVIPPWRRQGIGRALIEILTDHANKSSAAALYAMQKVEAGSSDEQGWRRLGFTPLETVIYHELSLRGIEAKLNPLYEWIRAKDWIPDNAEIIPLCDADIDAVADLHLKTLGGNRDSQLNKMRGEGIGAYHPYYSRVLLIDGHVMGCVLGHRESKEVTMLDANIIDPAVRRGWANLWLKLEGTRAAVESGVERLVYTTFDQYTDSRATTEMLGGEEKRKMLLMHRPIESGHDADVDE